MKKRGLIGQLYRFYLLIIVLSFLIITIMASGTLRNFHHKRTFNELLSKGRLIEEEVGKRLTDNPSDIENFCVNLGRKSGDRITVILPSGLVVGDSDENPARMDNHGDRPEVKEALQGRVGESIRYSYTLKTNLLYVALPVEQGGRTACILRMSMPLNSVDGALKKIYLQFALGGGIMAILAVLVSYVISRRLSRPLMDLKEGAERFAAGDLKFRLPVSDLDEIASLVEAMSQMATQLDETLQSLIQQRNFLDAILSSMVEGVITVNEDQNIISINRAAMELFGIAPPKQTRSIQETIRNTQIQQFVQKTLSSAESTEDEISISGANDILLHLHGTALHDNEGKKIGAVIVLNNITKLRRLESVRRDFVANVSHELRTPITSIKGFIETLENGAINNPEDAARFLGILSKQSDRLNSIVEDLLSLSRIEQETEKNEIVTEKGPIRGTLENAIEASQIKAAEKQIKIELDCDTDIAAPINATLLEQAVINLLDNAIKYSEPAKIVKIESKERENHVVISVIDQGSGIEKEHLPRLFERFYRVDKARSRKLGGTGLGLAIVKHIAIAHKGSVSVESDPGKGSAFHIHIPKT